MRERGVFTWGKTEGGSRGEWGVYGGHIFPFVLISLSIHILKFLHFFPCLRHTYLYFPLFYAYFTHTFLCKLE